MTDKRIAIIGAGIGGLACAMALQARGINASIYEQSPQLTEIGAAIALSANGTRELQRLGWIHNFDAHAVAQSSEVRRRLRA